MLEPTRSELDAMTPESGEPLEEPRRQRPPLLIIIALCALVAFGVARRYYDLNQTLIWHDEALQLINMSGFSTPQLVVDLSDRVITFAKMDNEYQRNGLNHSPGQLLKALSVDQPEHAPAMHIAMYYWGKLFGYSDLSMRQLSVVCGLLQLPAAYFLAYELCGTAFGGFLAACLLAGSPFAIFYSQEIRDYPLSYAMIMLTSALLVRACRKPKSRVWIAYGLATGLAIYVNIINLFTLAGHAVYVLLNEGKIKVTPTSVILSTRTLYYVLAALFSFVLCYPLLALLTTNYGHVLVLLAWFKVPIPREVLINAILFNPGTIFYWGDYRSTQLHNCALAILFILLIGWTIAAVSARDKKVIRLCVALLVPTVLTVWLPDLFFGGQRSLITKYYFSGPLSVLLLATYAMQARLTSALPTMRFIASFELAFVMICEVASDFQLLEMKERAVLRQEKLAPVGRVVRADPGCLIVSTDSPERTDFMQVLALSHQCPGETRFLWVSDPDNLHVSEDHFYLYHPISKLRQAAIKDGYTLKPVEDMDYFYKAVKNKSQTKMPNGTH